MESLKLLLQKSYHIDAEKVEALIGYANVNYRISDYSGNQYILKEYKFEDGLKELIYAESNVLSV